MRYQRKPEVVKALQWNGDAAAMVDFLLDDTGAIMVDAEKTLSAGGMTIKARLGEWVIIDGNQTKVERNFIELYEEVQ